MLEKKKNSKTIIFLIIWIVIFSLIPFMVQNIEENRFKENISYISSEFDIEEYNVTLNVDKDNKMDVTEQFTINIPASKEFNGIYKSIPLWKKYHDNGKEVKSKVKITNLRAIGEKYVLNKSNDNIGIRIGSTRTTVTPGLHTYTIKYRYDFGIDLNNKEDEFIFNLFDNYDNTKIKNMNVSINMPKALEEQNITFLREKEDITKNVKIVKSDKNIQATLEDYLLNESITIKMIFPEGYFVGGAYNYGFICFLICISIIVMSIVSFSMWKKYGKDYDKKCKTVEFYPPEDLDCAQIGYIYGEKSIKKLTTALIIQLASKGYVSIKEISKNKYKIINTGKTKEKLDAISISEQLVYQELFKNGDTNILSEDKTFSNVFGKINKTLENTIDKKVNDLESRKRKNITYIALIIAIAIWMIAYIYIKDLNPKFEILYKISFISIFITGFFSIIMERKTAYGELIIAKVLGFKNYLEVAEKEEIEAMIEKDPKYFYKILPYSYVLGVSKKWINLFEKNNIPNIDLDAFDNYANDFFIM